MTLAAVADVGGRSPTSPTVFVGGGRHPRWRWPRLIWFHHGRGRLVGERPGRRPGLPAHRPPARRRAPRPANRSTIGASSIATSRASIFSGSLPTALCRDWRQSEPGATWTRGNRDPCGRWNEEDPASSLNELERLEVETRAVLAVVVIWNKHPTIRVDRDRPRHGSHWTVVSLLRGGNEAARAPRPRQGGTRRPRARDHEALSRRAPALRTAALAAMAGPSVGPASHHYTDDQIAHERTVPEGAASSPEDRWR